ncbi:MAG TPA: exopolysaccharide biosynthesis protein, partial [Solirubrobacterales bacterium]|nr:exopolysaccharide biosynthesis protein [Solirubrobacterales bacterium]
VHGLALVLAGVLLMFPLGLVPFSNTLPGIAILLLSLGIVERDGLFIVGGHLMNLATIVYFGVLAFGAYKAGQGLLDFLWQVMPG